MATSIWESALHAKWDRAPVWVHGDVAVGNLLVQRGRLCAVIDFGQLAAGDPSCDTTIAWTLFSGSSRAAFLAELNVDEATWVRGRGWALWKGLISLSKFLETDTVKATEAQRVIDEIITDHKATA